MFKVSELLRATGGKLLQGSGSLNIKGVSIDSRTIKKGEAFIGIKGKNFNGEDFIGEAIKKGAGCLISVSAVAAKKYKKIPFIKVRDSIEALGHIGLLQRKKFNIPVIAVTGSNGKTTTKEMISWVLAKEFRILKNEGTKNNQIGLPLALINLNPSCEIAVLELGTNHFGEIEYLTGICLPNIGVITNIAAAHLEYFGNLRGVFKEKYSLIDNLEKPYVAILNADNNILKEKLEKPTKVPFLLGVGVKEKSDFFASNIEYNKDKIEFLVNQKFKFTLNTLGYYNIYNALIAIAIARILGMEYKDIGARLNKFIFPKGRLNMLTLNKIRFIDDTYNANPGSLKQALEALDNIKTKGKRIFIMGDMLELGKDRELFHKLAGRQAARHCDILITVGELSKFTAEEAKGHGLNINNIFTCESSYEARDILFNKLALQDNDIVLLKGSRAMKMEEVIKD